MFIAESKDNPGHYAVSPDYGDEQSYTTEPALAFQWQTKSQCETWSNLNGSVWIAVKRS